MLRVCNFSELLRTPLCWGALPCHTAGTGIACSLLFCAGFLGQQRGAPLLPGLYAHAASVSLQDAMQLKLIHVVSTPFHAELAISAAAQPCQITSRVLIVSLVVSLLLHDHSCAAGHICEPLRLGASTQGLDPCWTAPYGIAAAGACPGGRGAAVLCVLAAWLPHRQGWLARHPQGRTRLAETTIRAAAANLRATSLADAAGFLHC